MGSQVVNAVFHIFFSFYYSDFSPGVITATLLYLPLNYFIIKAAFNEGFLRNKIEVIFSEKFLPRRGRINCSMQDKDGWRWFGTQFTLN